MNKVLLLLQAIAVFSIYLITSIPAVFALQINIFMPGGASSTVTLNPGTKIERNITIVHDPLDSRWENVLVKVEVVGRDPAYEIDKIFLLKCRNQSPGVCYEYSPVEAGNYLSGEKGTFFWNDVSASGLANFLTIVQMRYNGRTIWVGFWDEISRVSLTEFVHSSYDLSSLDLYAKPGADSGWIRQFIETYFMAPMAWIERVVLGTVGGKIPDKTYKLGGSTAQMEVPVLEAQTEDGNVVTSTSKDYMLVFGKGSVSNPFTIFSGSPASCGDGTCESTLGENSQSCCRDCGCQGSGQCTVTGDYPNGVCHECANGLVEPTENFTNCCADAGCPAGMSCNTGLNAPYGTCILPTCGNDRCDSPAETVDNCCTDCGGSAACASAHGQGFYCNAGLLQCITPECGNGACEPGESGTNCCADCGGCPSGEYCNTDELATGVCMPTNCGNGACEPGETYANCCTDCDGCPADSSGNQQTCSANKCHFCGNGVVEAPAETESTCCRDTGCADENKYCSQTGGCKARGDMGLNVLVIPESIDCTIGERVTLRISLQNRPEYFDSFYSASYTYLGTSKPMTCTESGNYYECEIPTDGADSFLGCFESGQKSISLTVTILYYKDGEAESSGDRSTATLSGTAGLNIQKSRSRVCNRNAQCEAGIGETSESCCWDCGCGFGLVCTSAGCSNEGSISMQVEDAALPRSSQIDCSAGTGFFNIFASVTNIPYSAGEPFSVVRWELVFGNDNYTESTLPGFSCGAETNVEGMATGRIICTIPVSVFPPCPYNPPADLTLKVGVIGGGLSDIFGTLSGKELSDDFSLDYIKGLPLCGNGLKDSGETSANCCRDMGCPAGTLCSLFSGCIDQAQMDINVSVVPITINCSQGSGRVAFIAEVEPKPLSILRFEQTMINRTGIDHFCNQDGSNSNRLRCEMPVSAFPYCWETGPRQVSFVTTMVYMDGNDTETKTFSKPAGFFVTGSRERQCNANGACESDLGELPDLCCQDCGCTAGNICSLTGSYSCMSPADVSLQTGSVNTVDCSGQEGYFVNIDAEIINQPHGITNIRWYTKMGNQTFGPEVFSCDPFEGENKYRCEVSVYNFPLCHGGGRKDMTLGANITYTEPQGYRSYIAVERAMSIDTKNYMSSCTNNITGGDPACQPELGENERTCCQDCGCSSFGADYVCTYAGCQSKNTAKLAISPSNLTVDCTLIPASATEESITGYECHADKPIEIDAIIQNLPVHSEATELLYYLDGNKSGKIQDNIAAREKTARGWKVAILPRPIVSSTKNIKKDYKLNLGLTLVVNDQGRQTIIPLESQNQISLTYNVKISDHLISLENKLKDAEDAASKFNTYFYIIAFVIGLCTPCYMYRLGPALVQWLGITSSFWATILTNLIGWAIAGITVGGISSIAQSAMIGSAIAFAIGYGLGFLWMAKTCVPGATCICAQGWFITACIIVTVAAVAAMIFLMSKMEKSTEGNDVDIQKDIALAKAEVHDDLSFYYDQQASSTETGGS